MSDYAKLQTRCQRGEGRIADANNLLAECYGALGRLIAENERLSIASGCHLLRAQTLEVERDELLGNLAGAQGMLETAYSERDQLKAQVEKFRTDAQDALAGQMHLINERDLLKAENEALRKRVQDLSPFKGAPLTGPSLKCLACGVYHYGMQGLPCPNMKITAQAELPEFRSGQVGNGFGMEEGGQ